MTMTRVCAWCGEILHQGRPEADITHGICPECATHFTREAKEPLQSFIDRLGAPILLVNDTGTVLTVNKSALNAIGKVLEQVRGYKGGDVVECAYAGLHDGCGNTEHCAACTIRNTVMATHLDGICRTKVEAYQDIRTPAGIVRMRFLISTEKEGDLVLLRIDEMGPSVGNDG